ncbi:hypothetical protein EVAR_74361_1 [Eumeta japonica]|uniref:Uncharacterized protein n=1 Tax=Eumeta variegata TaxID=151549 RepID=A0A4C1SDC0_EUMVA|nr:hypothetical protein EVAR_74361_1 [Eumeta japonica]
MMFLCIAIRIVIETTIRIVIETTIRIGIETAIGIGIETAIKIVIETSIRIAFETAIRIVIATAILIVIETPIRIVTKTTIRIGIETPIQIVIETTIRIGIETAIRSASRQQFARDAADSRKHRARGLERQQLTAKGMRDGDVSLLQVDGAVEHKRDCAIESKFEGKIDLIALLPPLTPPCGSQCRHARYAFLVGVSVGDLSGQTTHLARRGKNPLWTVRAPGRTGVSDSRTKTPEALRRLPLVRRLSSPWTFRLHLSGQKAGCQRREGQETFRVTPTY